MGFWGTRRPHIVRWKKVIPAAQRGWVGAGIGWDGSPGAKHGHTAVDSVMMIWQRCRFTARSRLHEGEHWACGLVLLGDGAERRALPAVARLEGRRDLGGGGRVRDSRHAARGVAAGCGVDDGRLVIRREVVCTETVRLREAVGHVLDGVRVWLGDELPGLKLNLN